MSKSVELDKIIDAVTYEIGYPGHGSITLGDWAEAFVKALSIQQEADAKDAARYRWLRDPETDLDALAEANWGKGGEVYSLHQFDRAIDIAMATPTDSEEAAYQAEAAERFNQATGLNMGIAGEK